MIPQTPTLIAAVVLFSIPAILGLVFVSVHWRARNRRRLQHVYVILFVAACLMRCVYFALQLISGDSYSECSLHVVYNSSHACILAATVAALSIYHECLIAFKGLKVNSSSISGLMREMQTFRRRGTIFFATVVVEVIGVIAAQCTESAKEVGEKIEFYWSSVLSIGVGLVTLAIGIRLRLRFRRFLSSNTSASASSSSASFSSSGSVGGSLVAARSNEAAAENVVASILGHFTVGAGIVSVASLARGVFNIILAVNTSVHDSYFHSSLYPFSQVLFLFLVEWCPYTLFLVLLLYLTRSSMTFGRKSSVMNTDVRGALASLEMVEVPTWERDEL